jgi:nitrogen fixation/metabolism regulation signal transduction histidine kinase
VRIDTALEDALELSRTALDLRMREVLKQTQRMAELLIDSDESMAALNLGEMLDESDASELTLFAQSGHIIATAGSDTSVMVPSYPPEIVRLQVNQGHAYVSLDPIRGVGFHIRTVVQVPAAVPGDKESILQALFPVPERLSVLADSVRAAFDDYNELTFLRDPLKTSFIWTLSLVLLFGVLIAFWAALYSARGLVEPIRDLAEGTRAVAAGQYDKQLPLASNDELGFLVHSFNQMTRNLAQARDAAQRSRRLVEQQRAYLEIVLARLSSGVLTLDHQGHLRTYNTAASQILKTDLGVLIGDDGGASVHSYVRQFFEAIHNHLSEPGDWRQEITLLSSGGRQVLMCRGRLLPDSAGLKGGHVIVFDDITTLVKAQRDAAWTEVARRLAHEIKNPLTPIQLAAERIRHKYLAGMDAEQGRILERGTHTIVQQVQAMKDMVNAFNEYARPPSLKLTTVDLNGFVTDVLYLYKDHPAGVTINLKLDPEAPCIEADRGRLRQLLHNLVQNAIEAIAIGQGSALWVSTQRQQEASTDYVELSLEDDGPGFPENTIGDIFEPYVTTKTKGTGLGLAIVKKIVEEHGGLIQLKARPGGGAIVAIHFPSSTTALASMSLSTSSAVNQ